MSKAIPGRRSPSPEAAPPPARSSRIPSSVIRCLCTAPEMRRCDITCNAALTRRPSHCGAKICFFSALAHGDSVCCSHSGDEAETLACSRGLLRFSSVQLSQTNRLTKIPRAQRGKKQQSLNTPTFPPVFNRVLKTMLKTSGHPSENPRFLSFSPR